MIDASTFLDECVSMGYRLFIGTPCSFLKPLIDSMAEDKRINLIQVQNEGDAIAFACGAVLGGEKPVVFFQNSGLGNAVNPLSSLSQIMRVPFLGIVSLRGDPEVGSDEPQHELMGKITTDLLNLLEIPWSDFPSESKEVIEKLLIAKRTSEEKSSPFFFILRKGNVRRETQLENNLSHSLVIRDAQMMMKAAGSITHLRREALQHIKKVSDISDVLIATTGLTGRELYDLEDSENQLYMVGSMGCALAIGLGLSQTIFQHKIFVIDGDGALLMRMGNMATAGFLCPKNLIHILLDNGAHDSTGGQRTYSEEVDFCLIARACGYEKIDDVDSIEDFEDFLFQAKRSKVLSFIRFRIKPGSLKTPGRPLLSPEKVFWRLKEHIEKINNG